MSNKIIFEPFSNAFLVHQLSIKVQHILTILNFILLFFFCLCGEADCKLILQYNLL